MNYSLLSHSRRIVLFYLLLTLYSIAGKATTIYSRSGTGYFTDTAHWTPAQVPGTSDSVVIVSGTEIIDVSTGSVAWVQSINVQSGGTFFNNNGVLHVNSTIRVDGTWSEYFATTYFMGSNCHLCGATTISTMGYQGHVYIYGNLTVDAGTTVNMATAPLYIEASCSLTNLGNLTASPFMYSSAHAINGASAYWTAWGDFSGTVYIDASASGNTFEYSGGSTTVFPSNGGGYNNLTVSYSASTKSLSADVTVNGNFTLSSGYFNCNGHTISLKGNYYNYNGTYNSDNYPNVTFIGSGTQTIVKASTYEYFNNLTLSGTGTVLPAQDGVVVENNFTINSGTYDSYFPSGPSSPMLEVYGNWKNLGGTYNARSSQVYFVPNTVNDTFYSWHGLEAFYNVEQLNPGTLSLNSNMQVSNTLNLAAGTLHAGSATIILGGNWINTGGTFVPGTGTVILKGGWLFTNTISKSSGAESFYNLTDTSAGTLTTTASCALNIANNLSIYSGNSLVLATTATIGGNALISSGTFNAGAAHVSLGGNWTNNGTLTTATGSLITLNGSSSQTINKGSGTETFRKLTVNKSAGTVTLNCPLNIPDTLHLIRAQIVTTSTNLLSLNNGTGLVGGSDTAYVSGAMGKYGNTAFTFPLGSTSLSTGAYHPLSISAPSSTTDEFVAQYYPTGQTYGSAADDSIQNLSTSEYWTLKRAVGSSTPQITLGWNSNNSLDDSYYDYRVVAWDGTAWRNKGNAAFTSSGVKGSIKTATAVAYSPNPQPITIAKIKFYAPFAVLRRKLDGGYTTINSHGILAFIYPEEYNDTDSKLTYNLYDKNNTVIASNAIALSGFVPVVNYGDNRYGLNLLSSSLGLSSVITHGNNYVLEVINEKNEKWYLRARY